MFNVVEAYRHLLLTVHLLMADRRNPNLFVCCCWTWICLDITRLYEEQRQPSSGFAWPACLKKSKSGPHCWGQEVCQNRGGSSTTCRLCRLEQSYGLCLRFLGFIQVDLEPTPNMPISIQCPRGDWEFMCTTLCLTPS